LLGRALGGRDLAIGLGGLWALTLSNDEDRSAAIWLAAGALADALDVAATAAAWRHLPATGRVLVGTAAAGGVLTGAYATARLARG
jgi:acyl-coenzyme A thioesterase PaaI-like protein